MAKRKRKSPPPTPVEAVRHKDKRKNIPTEELRDFVREEEQEPKKILYPRDPDLDPQLVWRGKDEQDQRPLEVPAVPIYIQEKIHPQAIIEDFRRNLPSPSGRGPKGEGQTQLDLFSDFNGLPDEFADRVDFYHHEGNWSNRLILGDSLLVMTSLAEKENLKGQVQMIYIDPPYGIKFGSNWQVSTRKRDVRDGKPEDLVRQPEQIKAFRDTWELGIHSYLSYLRDRLVVARELLTESGSIFVQIGDENVHLVRCLLDEVFGSENFRSLITVRKTGGLGSGGLTGVADYILWYARDAEKMKYRPLCLSKADSATASAYNLWIHADGDYVSLRGKEQIPENARAFQPTSLHTMYAAVQSCLYDFTVHGKQFRLPPGRQWSTTLPNMLRLVKAQRVFTRGSTPRFVRLLDDFPVTELTNIWADLMGSDEKVYIVQTSTRLIERCLLMTTDPGDLVLDPTCGSGTTAYVAEQWGRRWITIDTSRVALTLARTRLMAARFPYYHLADDHPEIAQMNTDEEIKYYLRKSTSSASSVSSVDKPPGDVRKGFIYKRVPHITLKSIANNEEIDTIHARWQPKVEAALAQLNAALRGHKVPFEVTTGGRAGHEVRFDAPAKETFTMPSGQVVPAYELVEWEVPRQAPKDWPAAARKALEKFWELRLARQKEIDASIARHAEYEVLYDQPYQDPRRVRVTGPFTVESLSPHRTISAQEKRDRAETPRDWGAGGQAPPRTLKVLGPDQFGRMILDNLRAAGVQTGKKGERLKFETLEPYAGQWIHGVGTYTEKADGGATNQGQSSAGPSTIHSSPVTKRAAICIGPEHGTVGPELIKEAAKEAVQGVGFDVLVVCGFAFDPHVSEEAKRYGRLVVLPCRMNPDLAMGDLLKKTGSGNLFMVFGEPDIVVRRVHPQRTQKGTDKSGKNLRSSVPSVDQFEVEIKGVDVYDPTTGEIRSSSTDDIACWFIDTNYNGESFFVRHAYFTGADRPYEKLKRALRAEIDEAAWSALYSTVSRPFPRPETGKIAVKVINHYGDEVLKVYEV